LGSQAGGSFPRGSIQPDKPCTLPDDTQQARRHPGPATDSAGESASEVGLIVKYNSASGHWEDELRRNWDRSVRFRLPDADVFALDANSLEQTAEPHPPALSPTKRGGRI
jgi:hypothetical protein